jgi:hypothetical protein
LAEEIRTQLKRQSDTFQKLQKSLNKNPIIKWKKAKSIKPNHQKSKSKQEESCELIPRQKDELVKALNKYMATCDPGMTTPPLNSTAVISASERSDTPSDTESYTPSVSDSESEIADSDSSGQLRESIVFDSLEVDVQPKSQIFIDIDIDLSICSRSDPGVWKFCTRSLILPDNGEAIFMLQNPCEELCEHVSVYTRSAVGLDEQSPPQTLEVSLCNIPTDIAPPTTLQDQLSLSFTVVTSACLGHNYTQFFHKQDGMEWVAGRPELLMIVNVPDSGIEEDDDNETRTGGDEEQNSEQVREEQEDKEETDEDKDEDEEEQNNEVPNPPDQNCGLGPFSSIPCLFCKQDALNPRWSGGGNAGFLVGRNQSLRMTCERCNDSTWISAMTWGPSFPGGHWLIGG